MIKGVLIEKRKTYAIVLTEDGDFQKTGPVSDIEIGEEAIVPPIEDRQSFVSVFSNLFKHSSIRISTALALILILIFPIYSWVGQSNNAEAYVSIDINPSIELTVNKNDEVIDITGLNKDGTILINELKWQDESAVDLAEAIIQKSGELGYLQKDHEVMVGISYLNDEDESDLLGQISEKLNNYNDRIKVAMFTIPEHVRKQAHHKNQSMNLTYASETLTTYYEEQESNKSKDTNVSKDEEDVDQENEAENPNSRSNAHEHEQKVEIMKRFIKRSNADSLPPGLMKKIQEDQSLPPGLEKKENKQDKSSIDSQEDDESKDENETERDRHPSNKEDDHPSDKGKDHPSNKVEDHPSNRDKDHPSNKKEDETPSNSEENNTSPKEKGHPSDEEDGHPSHSNGNGPPDRSEDHPSNKGEGHPANKGEDHPSNKDDDHPSNRGKHSDKE
ncbi:MULTISPECIES: anti-sigma factor domain-containing protein [Allobacillus]|uniref:anti-sigma factor domain-containing protein n=1 Tax=Allobacillus TaxID=1400133 RepID=UPI0016428A6D|nr:anti-sigma factor domain-containing protein [Allobacillus salarius]